MKAKRKLKMPHFCRKRGSRTFSDHSLSQLLQIASYKKRINDLTKNNRLLTSALQESLVEAASQSSLLKNYARDINQILFARLKLNDMAKNLAKFATDLEEVQNYLNISLPAEYNFFQKKGSSNERIIKAPDVSTITEDPELSKNETVACENSPDDVFLSNSEENVASVNHDIEMTPILFVNDAQETKQKKRSSGIDKGSLTPQLNIDFTFVNQRRSTRSRGKTPSLGKKSSVSGRLISHINAASTPLTQKVEHPAQIKEVVLKSPSDLKNIERKSKNLKIPFQNHSNELVAISHDDCSIMQSSDLSINGSESTASNIDLNQPSELNEEVCPLEPQINENNSSFKVKLEDNLKISINADEKNINLVNDKLSPENDLQKSINTSQNTSSFLSDIQVSEINKYDKEIENVGSLTFCDSDDEDDNGGSEKKSAVSPRVRSSRFKKPLKYSDYVLSDDSDIDSPFKLAVVKRSRSGSKRIKLNSTPNGKSCEKTITENVDGISSDVVKEITETDYSVYNLDVSNSKKQKKKSKKKTSSQKSKNKVNDLPKPLFQKYSVTKLKPGKLKFSKFEISMEPKTVSKLSENPLQNLCASPGGILKKTRPSLLTSEDKVNETPLNETRYIDQNQDSKQQSMLQTPKRVSFAPTDLVCKFEKMSESKAVANNRKVRRTSKSAIDLKDLFEEADSPKTVPADNLSKETGVQKLNNSILYDFFAETELYTLTLPLNKELTILPVDNTTFSKPCTSKISEQTKLLNNDNDKHVLKSPKTPPQFLVLPTGDAVSSKTSASKQMKLAKNGTDKCIEKSPRRLVLCPISPSNDAASSKLSSFIVSEPIKLVNNENSKFIKKSPGTPGSLGNTNKLSEKENETPNKALSQLNSEKAEKLLDMLFLESPMTLVKRPKRKSLFKESSDDESKENINFDCPAPEKSSLKNITCTNKNSSSTTPTVKKKISGSKSQTRVHSKISAKKNKKSNLEIKSLEQSPVLTDATNVIASTDETHSRRRSKQVSYKEPSLNKKLRR